MSFLTQFHISVILFIIQFQYSHKRLLRYFDITHLTHPFLTFLLFFQKLPLTGNIAAIAFGKNVFTHRSEFLPSAVRTSSVPVHKLTLNVR